MNENKIYLKCSKCWSNASLRGLDVTMQECFPARGIAICCICQTKQKIEIKIK